MRHSDVIPACYQWKIKKKKKKKTLTNSLPSFLSETTLFKFILKSTRLSEMAVFTDYMKPTLFLTSYLLVCSLDINIKKKQKEKKKKKNQQRKIMLT